MYTTFSRNLLWILHLVTFSPSTSMVFDSSTQEKHYYQAVRLVLKSALLSCMPLLHTLSSYTNTTVSSFYWVFFCNEDTGRFHLYLPSSCRSVHKNWPVLHTLLVPGSHPIHSNQHSEPVTCITLNPRQTLTHPHWIAQLDTILILPWQIIFQCCLPKAW